MDTITKYIDDLGNYYIICPSCQNIAIDYSVELIETKDKERFKAIDIDFSCQTCGTNWGVIVSRGRGVVQLTIETNIRPVEYKAYIQSPEWKERADAAKERAGYRCQLCNKSNKNTPLHAHHRTYERLGNEDLEDITVLCQMCHAKFHDK